MIGIWGIFCTLGGVFGNNGKQGKTQWLNSFSFTMTHHRSRWDSAGGWTSSQQHPAQSALGTEAARLFWVTWWYLDFPGYVAEVTSNAMVWTQKYLLGLMACLFWRGGLGAWATSSACDRDDRGKAHTQSGTKGWTSQFIQIPLDDLPISPRVSWDPHPMNDHSKLSIISQLTCRHSTILVARAWRGFELCHSFGCSWLCGPSGLNLRRVWWCEYWHVWTMDHGF